MNILSKEEYNLLKKKDHEQWLKYCLDLCNECKWQKNKIATYGEAYGYTSEERIIKNAKTYCKEYLKMSSKDFFELKLKYNPELVSSKYNILLDNLIKINEESKIEELFIQEKYDMNELINKIPQYIRIHKKELSKEEQKELEKSILYKLRPIIENSKKIQEIKRNNKLKEQQRERDIETLELFKEVIKGNITEKELLKRLEKQRYTRCLELLKEIDANLYISYQEKLLNNMRNQLNKDKIIEKSIYEIVSYLKNGIKDKEEIRPFDIVDLYIMYNEYINDIPKNINKCCLTIEEIRMIKNFLRKDSIADKKIIEKEKNALINGIDRFNCETNEKGILILNSGTIIPKEEKISWFDYLENNNIPVTRRTYNTMLKRYKQKNERNKSRKLNK